MNPITREMMLDRIRMELDDLYPKSRSKQGTKNTLLSLISTAMDFKLITRTEYSTLWDRIHNENQTRVRLISTNPLLKEFHGEIGTVLSPDVSLLPNHPFPETPKPNALVKVHFDHLYLHTEPTIHVSKEAILGIPYQPELPLDEIEVISEHEYQSIKSAIERGRKEKETQERMAKTLKRSKSFLEDWE